MIAQRKRKVCRILKVVVPLQPLHVRPPPKQLLYLTRRPQRKPLKVPLKLRDPKRRPLPPPPDWLRLYWLRMQVVPNVKRTMPPLPQLFKRPKKLPVQLLNRLQKRKHNLKLAKRQHRKRHRLKRPLHVQPVLYVKLKLLRQRNRPKRRRRKLQLPLRRLQHRRKRALPLRPLLKRLSPLVRPHPPPQPRAPRRLPPNQLQLLKQLHKLRHLQQHTPPKKNPRQLKRPPLKPLPQQLVPPERRRPMRPLRPLVWLAVKLPLQKLQQRRARKLLLVSQP